MARYDESLTEGQKWMISFWSGFLFLIIASPCTYKLTGVLFEKLGIQTSKNGCPYIIGLILHTIVFSIFIRIMMIIKLPGT